MVRLRLSPQILQEILWVLLRLDFRSWSALRFEVLKDISEIVLEFLQLSALLVKVLLVRKSFGFKEKRVDIRNGLNSKGSDFFTRHTPKFAHFELQWAHYRVNLGSNLLFSFIQLIQSLLMSFFSHNRSLIISRSRNYFFWFQSLWRRAQFQIIHQNCSDLCCK